VDVIHTNRMNSLALMLENESWSQADVATEFQQIVDLMVTPNTSMMSLPASLPDGALTKELNIGDTKYHVVNSSLMLIKMLKEYLQCLEQLPLLSTDILQKIVEILKVTHTLLIIILLSCLILGLVSSFSELELCN
jgi:vacuolar protein sorting-associated protein 54